MALLEQGRLVADRWQLLAEGETGGETRSLLLPYARFAQEKEIWRTRGGALGILFPNDVDPSVLAPDLSLFSLIVLTFPTFRDGRAYSQARLLRERYGWRGRLRARGEVLMDQYFFMRRCGFDSFEVPDSIDVKAWEEAARVRDRWYQPAAGLAGKDIFLLRQEKNKVS